MRIPFFECSVARRSPEFTSWLGGVARLRFVSSLALVFAMGVAFGVPQAGAQTAAPAAPSPAAVAPGDGVCVICDAPRQSYRCVVVDATGRVRKRAAFACMQRLARDGRHDACRVRRGGDAACQGIEAVVTVGRDAGNIGLSLHGEDTVDGAAEYGAGPLALPDIEAESVQADEALRRRHAREGEKDGGPPRTVEEAANGAVEATREQFAKTGTIVKDAALKAGEKTVEVGEVVTDTVVETGQTVGSAAKTAFDCVVSLFSRCD